MLLYLVLYGVLFTIAVLYAWRIWGIAKRASQSGPGAAERSSWDRLLNACRGDRASALRLRDAEKARMDDTSDEEACERAYQRLLRDRE